LAGAAASGGDLAGGAVRRLRYAPSHAPSDGGLAVTSLLPSDSERPAHCRRIYRQLSTNTQRYHVMALPASAAAYHCTPHRLADPGANRIEPSVPAAPDPVCIDGTSGVSADLAKNRIQYILEIREFGALTRQKEDADHQTEDTRQDADHNIHVALRA